MVRYIMSFTVPADRQHTAHDAIDDYFDDLQKNGPGGLRSQCYAEDEDDCRFVHLKSFRKESVANHHFRSALFRTYLEKLESICGSRPSFARLQQQQTFESIY